MYSKSTFLLTAALLVLLTGCRSDQPASAGVTPASDAAHVQDHEEPVAATVSGRVSGFDCAVVGELCPTTHRGGDYTTGVYTDDGRFFFVVNIPQSFLSQHFLETIEVEGRVYPPYEQAVEPEVIRVLGEDERLVYESGYFIDHENRRATFHEGRFEDGRWIAR